MANYSPVRVSAWRRQKGLCHYCKRPVAIGDATVDHVVPRSKGGKTKGNTVMACWTCNNRKGDMPANQFRALLSDPAAFVDQRARLSEARLEMWRKADARRCANLQPRSEPGVNSRP